MAKKKEQEPEVFDVDAALAAAGVNLVAAKARLEQLRAVFGGNVPASPLGDWRREFIDNHADKFWQAVVAHWGK